MDQSTIIWINAIFLATNIIFLLLNAGGYRVGRAFFNTNVEAGDKLSKLYGELHALTKEYEESANNLKLLAANLNVVINPFAAPKLPDILRVEMTENGLRIHNRSQ